MASKQKSKSGRSSVAEVSQTSKRISKVSNSSVPVVKDEERPSLAYKVLSAPKTKKLLEAGDVDELERSVRDILELNDTDRNLKTAAVLDYYVASLWWGKEQSYTADQMSAFYTVMDTLLSNLEKGHMSLADNIQQFKNMLAGIGCPEVLEDEAKDIGGLETLFDIERAKNLATYVHTSLFQHYALYQTLFFNDQSEHVVGQELDLELPPSADIPWPPPLYEAVTENIYKEFIQEQVMEEQPNEMVAENLPEDAGDITGEPAAVDEKETEQNQLTEEQEAELFAKLTPEQIQSVIEEVCSEMLPGLEEEIASKLRKKESDLVARINRISVTNNSGSS